MLDVVLQVIEHLAEYCEPPQGHTADYWAAVDRLEAIQDVLAAFPPATTCPLCNESFPENA